MICIRSDSWEFAEYVNYTSVCTVLYVFVKHRKQSYIWITKLKNDDSVIGVLKSRV